MKRAEDYVGGAIGLVVLATMVGVVFILGGQIFRWLKDGVWVEYPTSKLIAEFGFERPAVSWLGVQKIIDMAMDQSAALAIFVVGLASAWLVGWVLLGLIPATRR
jgi:hypothetical protein